MQQVGSGRPKPAGLRAAPGNAFFGTTLRRSDDLGATWSADEDRPVKFPEDAELSLSHIWQIRTGRDSEPGAGGLCMHTILTDPSSEERMVVASSTGGVCRTDDGGATWRPRNHGVRAEFLPDTVYIVPLA